MSDTKPPFATPERPITPSHGGHLDENLSLSARIKRLQAYKSQAQKDARLLLTSETPKFSKAGSPDDLNLSEPQLAGHKRTHMEMCLENDLAEGVLEELSVARRRVLTTKCINVLKTKVPVYADLETEIDTFLEASPLERLVLLYAENIATRRAIKESSKNTAYTIPQELNVNLQAYVWKFGFSPYLKKYKFPWAGPVLAAMREAGIRDLPSLTNEAQLAAVTSKINEIATKVRYLIKEVLEYSLGLSRKRRESSDSSKSNQSIIYIARYLAAKCSFAITVEFLQRLAILRDICFCYHRKFEKEDFWFHVDRKLHEYSTGVSDLELEEFKSGALELDLITYPRPDGLEGFRDIVVPADMIPESQRLTNKYARQSEY